jgi:hypothetical protein
MISLADVFVQSQPRMLLQTLISGTMHVRGTLCQINALKHMVRLFGVATACASTSWQSFLSEFASFRSEWFGLHVREQRSLLTHYLIRAVVVAFELMDCLSDYMHSSGAFEPSPSPGRQAYLTPGMRTLFRASWRPDRALEGALASATGDHRVMITLPLPFAQPLVSYVSQDGLLSRHVRPNLLDSSAHLGSWHPDLVTMARRHVECHNEHIRFLFANRLLDVDTNYHSLGLWAGHLTDPDWRRTLRTLYHSILRWLEVGQLALRKGT